MVGRLYPETIKYGRDESSDTGKVANLILIAAKGGAWVLWANFIHAGGDCRAVSQKVSVTCAIAYLRSDQPDLSGPVPMRDFGQFDRPVVTTAA